MSDRDPERPSSSSAAAAAAAAAQQAELEELRRDPPPDPGRGGENHYAVDQWLTRNQKYFMNLDWHLGRRPPMLAPLWGYSADLQREDIIKSLFTVSLAAGRRLTRDECNTLLPWASDAAVAASYSMPVAVGGTFSVLRSSWSRFFTHQRLIPAQGRALVSRIGAQCLRTGIYGAVGWYVLGNLQDQFEEIMFHKHVMMPLYMDPRLSQLRQDCRMEPDPPPIGDEYE